MIRSNLIYKLLALAVAVVIWGYVNSERNPHSRKTLIVPIKVRNIDRSYISDLETGEASVTLAGLKSAVDDVRKEDVSAWIDLAKAPKPGSTVSRLRARVSGVNEGDLEIGISPRRVRVTINARGDKRLPVEVRYLAAAPLGYSYSDPSIVPGSVRVSGRSARVQQVTRVVIRLPEQDSTSPIEGYFPVVPLDAKGNIVSGVELDHERVQLKLEFLEVPATKAVIVSPSVTGDPRFPARITRVTVQPSSVTLEGKPASLVGLSTVSTDRIEIDDAAETVTRDVSLRLPSGVDVVGRKTVRVTVYVATPPQ